MACNLRTSRGTRVGADSEDRQHPSTICDEMGNSASLRILNPDRVDTPYTWFSERPVVDDVRESFKTSFTEPYSCLEEVPHATRTQWWYRFRLGYKWEDGHAQRVFSEYTNVLAESIKGLVLLYDRKVKLPYWMDARVRELVLVKRRRTNFLRRSEASYKNIKSTSVSSEQISHKRANPLDDTQDPSSSIAHTQGQASSSQHCHSHIPRGSLSSSQPNGSSSSHQDSCQGETDELRETKRRCVELEAQSKPMEEAQQTRWEGIQKQMDEMQHTMVMMIQNRQNAPDCARLDYMNPSHLWMYSQPSNYGPPLFPRPQYLGPPDYRPPHSRPPS